MKEFLLLVVVFVIVIALGWYGNYYFKHRQPAEQPFIKTVNEAPPRKTVNEAPQRKTVNEAPPRKTVNEAPRRKTVDEPPPRSESDAVTFKCDGRTHCSHMTSCAEATFFIKNCPGTKMDGDNDGVPCETQWCY